MPIGDQADLGDDLLRLRPREVPNVSRREGVAV
jgi:hypothetical protein